MRASFEKRIPPGGKEPVEYVRIHTGLDGSDEVVRQATEADRARFKAAYAAFTAPPPEAKKSKSK